MTYALNSPPAARVESIFSTISVRPPDAAADMTTTVDIGGERQGERRATSKQRTVCVLRVSESEPGGEVRAV